MGNDSVAASFTINAREGLIRIEGSESFVRDQMGAFSELIEAVANQTASAKPAPPPAALRQNGANGAGSAPAEDNATSDDGANGNPYPSVISLRGGDEPSVEITVPELPGSTVKDQAVQAAKLYLLGMKLLGVHEVEAAVIRQECDRLGCFDSNFATNMNSATPAFLKSGTPRSRVFKLSPKGLADARELAQELEDELS